MRLPNFSLPLTALFTLWGAVLPSLARETVLEDSPGRLVLEVEAEAYTVGEGLGGQNVGAAGFERPAAPGAPDLPWYGFLVATGARLPAVSIEPVEWDEASVPQGLAGTPRWVTSRQPEAYKDPALFAAARGLRSEISDVELVRGLGVRKISLPTATYAEGSNRVRLMKKFRVTVTFPNPAATPSLAVAPWLARAAVKNVSGGAYLVALPRPAPLRRGSASKALSAGSFLKIKIGDRQVDGFEEDGVYALTYEAARAAGMPIGVRNGSLRVYTGPKDTLSVRLDSMVAPTLREIPRSVEDNNLDGTFNEGDRLLFYAQGTSIWAPIPGAAQKVTWGFKSDPWSYSKFYYVDWSGLETGALKLDSIAYTAPADTVTAAPHYLRGEKELATGSCDPAQFFDSETGFVWYWYWKIPCSTGNNPGFATASPMLSGAQIRSAPVDTLPGRASDSVYIGMYDAANSIDDFYGIYSQGAQVAFLPQGVPGAWYVKTSSDTSKLLGLDSVRWGGFDHRFKGYTVRYMRALAWAGRSRAIFPAATGARIGYRIDNAPVNLRVLRIESGVARAEMLLQRFGSTALFSDSVGAGQDVVYRVYQTPVTVAPSSVALESVPPVSVSGVIKDFTNTASLLDPEYLIITPQALLSEAVKLRDYRQAGARQTPLAVSIARTEDIYRNWSGGRMSPVAIRDFIRWTLNGGTNGTPGRLRYVLLYGDGHYDYRDIRNAASNAPQPNHIPPFNWDFNNIHPMSTDDFYATLDQGEDWQSSLLDVAIGRLPLRNAADAQAYLEKLKVYEDPKSAGEWRGRALLTSDDATQRNRPGNADPIDYHVRQSEDFGNRILTGDPGFRVEKLSLFDYKHNSSFVKPEATLDLLTSLNRGTLFFTFYGHGAYNQLADEVLLKTSDGLSRLTNRDKAFSMAIFSCTVGRFDKLLDEGMTEAFVRTASIGSISGLGAARESYSGPNENLGNAFALRLFSAESDTVPLGLGDVVREAKNAVDSGTRIDNRKYVLMGEPVTVLHRPGLGLVLDSVPDTLRALSCGGVKGHVTKGSGKGFVSVRIVSGDVPTVYSFIRENGSTGFTDPVKKRGQILFERTVPFTDSAFSVDYFLPGQLPFGDSTAKIQVFAWDTVKALESSALVSNLRILSASTTGSGSCSVTDDGRPPRIVVSGCNTPESGGADFPDKVKISLPYCLQITVIDSGGGVLSAEGPDEGTTVEVVGSLAPYHPQPGIDDLYLKTYQLTLSKQDLSEGSHLLKISSRDGFGNLGMRQVSLEVSQDTVLRFVKAFNVPNPMKRNGTTFHFSTTLPSEEGGDVTSVNVDRLKFDLRIFNQQGYMVQEFRDAKTGQVRWDGKDAWGRQLANGVYFYQVTATWSEAKGAPTGGRQVSKKNVLVISR